MAIGAGYIDYKGCSKHLMSGIRLRDRKLKKEMIKQSTRRSNDVSASPGFVETVKNFV